MSVRARARACLFQTPHAHRRYLVLRNCRPSRLSARPAPPVRLAAAAAAGLRSGLSRLCAGRRR